MSNFEDTTEDTKNQFLANPENQLLLVGTMTKLDNLIEKTHDEINSGTLIALKKPLQNNNLMIQ